MKPREVPPTRHWLTIRATIAPIPGYQGAARVSDALRIPAVSTSAAGVSYCS